MDAQELSKINVFQSTNLVPRAKLYVV